MGRCFFSRRLEQLCFMFLQFRQSLRRRCRNRNTNITYIMQRRSGIPLKNCMTNTTYTLGIDIGSTTVKIAILDDDHKILFSDYERHYANIQETLASLLEKAEKLLGECTLRPVITGSGGLTLANHLEIPFVQEVKRACTEDRRCDRAGR